MQMGNCLSPVLSNIYMEFFKKKIANGIITDDVFLLRYVDDVFTIMKMHNNFDDTLTNLNNLVPSINFTIEREQSNMISFLDVIVIRLANEFKFKVFRKPSNNNHIINAHSFHTMGVKRSALQSMFLRALNICNPKYIDEEFSYIYNIGYKNNFKRRN